jgi:hypothetical protein
VTAAIFGLLGVIVGGVLNGVVNWWLQRSQTKSSARAIAGVVYDEFRHLQSTLVRSLAAGEWWQPSYLFDEDLGRDDWKLLLGALDDRPSQDVAAARGWMTYVIARCREVTRNRRSDDQPVASHKLSPEDRRLMQDTFCRLDRAREQLAKLSGRDFSSFENGGVLATIDPPKTLAELGIAPDECRARRKEDYARVDR